MAADEIHVGDIGTRITMVVYDGDTIVDLAAFTHLQILLEPPDDASKTVAATLTSDGSDGSMYIITEDDTFDQAGEWGMQGYVETVVGDAVTAAWHTDVVRFTVYPNID